MPEEPIETQELQEKLEEALEHVEAKHGREIVPRWTTYLALSTAVIAVVAAVASLQSGSLSNEAILLKNNAVLNQAKASDTWSYYQAKGIKEKLYAIQAESVSSRPTLADEFRKEAARYKSEQVELDASARELEKKVQEDNEKAAVFLENHHLFAISVTFFQVGIALSAIASLTKRQPLWFLGLATSAVGLVYFFRGMLF